MNELISRKEAIRAIEDIVASGTFVEGMKEKCLMAVKDVPVKIMGEVMYFPETLDEFAHQYKIVDKQEVYTDGTELIPIFRVKQWLKNEQIKNMKLSKGGEKCMQESKYEVIVDNMVVAEGMNIDTATVLVKAFFKEYYNDHSMTISIREMERTEGVCEDGTK